MSAQDSLAASPATKSRKSKGCGPVRPSRRGKWRALALILVHVAAALHVWHWMRTGRTITPVEPSEAMQTLGQGLVNAGFVLFVALILSTLIFGRFFCGWGCHIVALQDLCTTVLRRLGLRPQPLRSRVLVYVPLAAAVFMFVAPTVVRLIIGSPAPDLQPHFMTDDFWDRFPGPGIAFLTFGVCGFLIVVLLGNKGFCTYGCPYGGIFGLADAVAPGRIRVTDACEGCGHCTATCTSNVRVHEEVRLHAMVVDPGCMKCMDCVSVCPKDALYFGFGKPAVAKGAPRAKTAPRRFDYSWREEIALGGLFLVSIVILRALYDHIPLLLALGLSSISAFVLVSAWRGLRLRDFRFARWPVRRGGRLTGKGLVFLVASALWATFLLHSALVQWNTLGGSRDLNQARASIDAADGMVSPESRARLERAMTRLLRAERWGLYDSAQHQARLASAASYLGDHVTAEAHYREAVAKAPKYAHAHRELARYAFARGNVDATIRSLERAVTLRPELPGALDELAGHYLDQGRHAEALELCDRLLRRRPHDVTIRLTRALVLGQSGQPDAAMDILEDLAAEHPHNPEVQYQRGRYLAHHLRFRDAADALAVVTELRPDFAEGHYFAARVAVQLGDLEAARTALDAALTEEPFASLYAAAWAALLKKTGELEGETARREQRAVGDRENRFRLLYLYRALERDAEADVIAAEFPEAGNPSP